MQESPAYRVLSQSGHRVLDRLEIEIGRHGGNDNGKLPTTFDQFEGYGIHRHAIAPAVREVVALGFVEITQEGRAGNAEWRRPNFFRLTYRHTEKTEPTDDWRKIKRWRRRSLSRALLDRLLKNKSPVAENAKSQCGLCTIDGKSLVRIPPLQALVRIPPLHLYLGAKSVGEVVQFPSRSQRPTGVRMAPSHRIAEMYELQVFEDGRWRAKSIHYSIEDAKEAAADIIVARLDWGAQ